MIQPDATLSELQDEVTRLRAELELRPQLPAKNSNGIDAAIEGLALEMGRLLAGPKTLATFNAIQRVAMTAGDVLCLRPLLGDISMKDLGGLGSEYGGYGGLGCGVGIRGGGVPYPGIGGGGVPYPGYGFQAGNRGMAARKMNGVVWGESDVEMNEVDVRRLGLLISDLKNQRKELILESGDVTTNEELVQINYRIERLKAKRVELLDEIIGDEPAPDTPGKITDVFKCTGCDQIQGPHWKTVEGTPCPCDICGAPMTKAPGTTENNQ